MANPSPATDERAAKGAAADNEDESNIVPTRPEQAPLVTVADIVSGTVPLGRRVRVTGRCAAAGTGRSAGLWTLAEGGQDVEVRGLVPKGCPGALRDSLTIFAQVERMGPGTQERLLLRLPD